MSFDELFSPEDSTLAFVKKTNENLIVTLQARKLEFLQLCI